MNKIFISYSSKDKQPVIKLAKDLRSRNFSVWLDEWEIDVGDDIAEKVEEGLKDATHVAVWLTDNSINSGWVSREWHVKIFQEITNKEVMVLPLLGKSLESDIPYFLSGKKYADFRTSYDNGMAQLLASLNKKYKSKRLASSADDATSIQNHTKNFLKDLESAMIPVPIFGNIRIIKSLQSLPRSGKLLRLEGMEPEVPIRSVFDHLLSVAHSADCLLPVTGNELLGKDRADLARVIAYHDICEILLGDVPQYTKLNRSKRNRANVAAQIRISQLPEGEPERISNDFIGMFLDESERDSLRVAASIIKGQTKIKKIFYALDKIDPIIAIWRYIHVFREVDGFQIKEFLNRTRHFFENPGVKTVVSKYWPEAGVSDLVDQLQSSDNAYAYYKDSDIIKKSLFDLDRDVVKKLIEGRELLFAAKIRKRNAPDKK